MKSRALFISYVILGFFFVHIFWTKFSQLFQIYYWKPDFNLILLFIFAQIFGRRYGLLVGAYLGLLDDFVTSFYGFGMLAKASVGFIAGHYFRFDEQYNYTTYVWGILICALFNNVVYQGLYYYGQQDFFNVIIQYMIPEAMYTVILGVLIYFILERWISELYVSRKSGRL